MPWKVVKYLLYVSVTVTPVILLHLTKKKYQKLRKRLQIPDESNYEVIFNTFANHGCRMHLYKRMACSETCSYNYLVKVIKFIESASDSISLCMCILTSQDIQSALVRAHSRGVNVRFITDLEMLGNIAAREDFLKNSGIHVKVQNNQAMLHHKFCLVDENVPGKSSLFFGSLNLTLQGFASNWDYIVFTNNQKIIQRFKQEFNFLWQNFKYLK